MAGDFASLKNKPSFRAAFIIPVAIVLIFSFFNLISVADPSTAVSNAKFGLVVEEQEANAKMVEQLVDVLKKTVPFASIDYAGSKAAAAALDKGEILAKLTLSTKFGQQLESTKSTVIEVEKATHLTLMENQLSSQIASTLQAAMIAAILSHRLAAATGEPPTPAVTMMIKGSKSSINPVAIIAPSITTFVIWLSAFVGSVLIFVTTRNEGAGKPVTLFRLFAPLIVSGISALVLATVISTMLSELSLLIKLWGLVWMLLLGLGWLFSGLFAWIGPLAVLIILPLVFLQSALGGTLAPMGAIPDWLQWLAGLAPFQTIGETLRSTILLNELQIPWMPALACMAIGLFLIISRNIFGRMKRDG